MEINNAIGNNALESIASGTSMGRLNASDYHWRHTNRSRHDDGFECWHPGQSAEQLLRVKTALRDPVEEIRRPSGAELHGGYRLGR